MRHSLASHNRALRIMVFKLWGGNFKEYPRAEISYTRLFSTEWYTLISSELSRLIQQTLSSYATGDQSRWRCRRLVTTRLRRGSLSIIKCSRYCRAITLFLSHRSCGTEMFVGSGRIFFWNESIKEKMKWKSPKHPILKINCRTFWVFPLPLSAES